MNHQPCPIPFSISTQSSQTHTPNKDQTHHHLLSIRQAKLIIHLDVADLNVTSRNTRVSSKLLHRRLSEVETVSGSGVDSLEGDALSFVGELPAGTALLGVPPFDDVRAADVGEAREGVEGGVACVFVGGVSGCEKHVEGGRGRTDLW